METKVTRIIVAGTRHFDDYELLKKALDSLILNPRQIVIISGTANGADKMGEIYALENKILVHRFFPEWEKYGKLAGHIRNEDMAQNGDMLLAFWDGKSTGTKSMIDLAKRYKLKVYIINYKNKKVEVI